MSTLVNVQVVDTCGSDMQRAAAVIFVSRDEVRDGLSEKTQKQLGKVVNDIPALFSAYNFEGCRKESFMHMGVQSDTGVVLPVIVHGLGSLDREAHENLEILRRAVGTVVSYARKTKKTEIQMTLPDAGPFGVSRNELVRQVTQIIHMACYANTTYKSKSGDAWEPTFVITCGQAGDQDACKQGSIIGQAMAVTRSLADAPGNHMTPLMMRQKAESIAQEYGLKITAFDQEEAREMGMGSYYSVAKGSKNPGQFVTLEYHCGDKSAPTIAFVGKGVCFDTGGSSLKPANSMNGMKYDMSGAAAVFGALQAIAQLKPNHVNVVGVTPLVENMPGGAASKPDDIVTAMDGTTIEIGNTDAEGRLILVDAICYTQKHFSPNVMIDIATLTGACAYFLGHFFSGLFTRSDAFAEQLLAIGQSSGDKLWRLPLTDEYKPALRSHLADISNIGNPTYKAGATTAGLFIDHFVDKKVTWAHLDIAGTDSKIPDATYLGKGATGVGVRLFVDFALSYNK